MSSPQFTKVSDYKAGKTHPVTLPSLLSDGTTHPVFVIKKPSPRVLIKLLNALEIGDVENIDKEEMERKLEEKFSTPDGQAMILDALDTLLTGAVVQPKIVVGPAKNDDEISTDDIDLDDQKAIMEAVMQLSGTSPESGEERKKSQSPQSESL